MIRVMGERYRELRTIAEDLIRLVGRNELVDTLLEAAEVEEAIAVLRELAAIQNIVLPKRLAA